MTPVNNEPPTLKTAHQPWADQALCAQVDSDLYFPEPGESSRQAKALCASCDVTGPCLDYALANDERFGVWAGTSLRQRRKLRASRAAS